MDQEAIEVRVEDRLAAVDPEEWDACAFGEPVPPGFGDGESASPDLRAERHNPFVSHAFLSSLEDSGCVRAETGWLPQHLTISSGGRLAAAMPAYLKSHSQGEYVFDHGWADAFERAGGRYYPKLQVSVPFTPVRGPRLLVRRDEDRERMKHALLAGSIELCRRHKASSIHWTFVSEADREVLTGAGMLERSDQQFHWRNERYGNFDDFLAALASRKRKAIRKERREALEAGIEIEWVSGSDLTEAHWDAFFEFYMDTGSRKWGRPYLNRRFFSLIGERMPERILLILAKRDGRYIAGALNLIGDAALYGRNWGCVEDHPFLHFEVCYYQAIEFAIERGLAWVEAGAQGQHKLARGYVPVTTHSAHYIEHAGLRRAVADYLESERHYVEEENRALARHAPYRRGGS